MSRPAFSFSKAAKVEHAAAGEALEMSGPRLVVSDGKPLGHRIAQRYDQRAGQQWPIAVLLTRALCGEGEGLAKQRPRGTGDRSPAERGIVGELRLPRRGLRRLTGVADARDELAASKERKTVAADSASPTRRARGRLEERAVIAGFAARRCP